MYKLSGWIGGLILEAYAKRDRRVADPASAQKAQLLTLVERARATAFGVVHDFLTTRRFWVRSG